MNCYSPSEYNIVLREDSISEDVISPETRKKENYYIKKTLFKLGSIKEAAAGAGWAAGVMNWNTGKITWGVFLSMISYFYMDISGRSTRFSQKDLKKELLKR